MIGTEYTAWELSIWLLVAALIGFVVGWILRKWWLDREQANEIAAIREEEEALRHELQTELDDWKGKATAFSSDLDLRTADLNRATTQVEQRDEKIASLETTVSESQSATAGLESKVADRESTIASLRADLEKEDPQVARLGKDLDAANATIGTLRKDADGYKGTIESLRADLDVERRKLSDLDGKLEAATSEANAAAASVASLRDGEGALQARIAELETAATGSTDLEAEVSRLEDELATVRTERDRTAADLQAVEANYAECADRLAAAEEEAAEAAAAATADPAAIADLPDKDVAVAKVAEIATRTRGSGPVVDDDLKKIHGVGPKLERLLKSMDITSFRQVANFTVEDIQYVTAALDAFPGRIERDDWMGSAAAEHAKKYGEPA